MQQKASEVSKTTGFLNAGGRPSKLSETLARRIGAEIYENGMPAELAYSKAGLDRTTVWRWKKKAKDRGDPAAKEFFAYIDLAEKARVERELCEGTEVLDRAFGLIHQ